MSPIIVRFSVLTFLGIATAITVNAVLLQDTELAHFQGQGKQSNVRPEMMAVFEKKALVKDVRHVAAVPQKDQLEAKIRDMLIVSDAALRPETTAVSDVKELQLLLIKLGYSPGQADGIAGPTTRAAIMAYELDKGLLQTGIADRALLDVLRGKSKIPVRHGQTNMLVKNSQELISALQKALTKLGYNTGTADGIMGPLTRRRIRAFERDQKLEITGRISGRLVAAINRAQGKPLVLAELR